MRKKCYCLLQKGEQHRKQNGYFDSSVMNGKRNLSNFHEQFMKLVKNVIVIKPNIMSRHNVVYVEACSFDNPLGGFVPGTKLNQ